MREVEEETGIAGSILTDLGSIEYWFALPSHRVHRQFIISCWRRSAVT